MLKGIDMLKGTDMLKGIDMLKGTDMLKGIDMFKTLWRILFFNSWTLMSVLYDDAKMDNRQEYKSFYIYAVTIKISITEYHHLINSQAYLLF